MTDTNDGAVAEEAGTTQEQLGEFGRAAAKAAEEAVARLEAKLAGLEGRAREAAKEAEGMRDDLVAETEKRVRANPIGSLFTALGIGFVLGLLFGVGRGR